MPEATQATQAAEAAQAAPAMQAAEATLAGPAPRSDALLAPLHGARPPAPAWFDAALAHAPERDTVNVQSAAIETLAWGQVGLPGVLLLHGNAAHADWYSYTAPLLARGMTASGVAGDTHRVVAMSFSGMGGSDWRERYSTAQWADEALAVAQACGLFESTTKPVWVAHSFGGFALMNACARFGDRLRAAVIVDTPLMSRQQRDAHEQAREQRGDAGRMPGQSPRGSRRQATLADALARFRLLPPQPCDNLYLVDHIARHSLKAVVGDSGAEEWTWRFDPQMFRDFEMGRPGADLAQARCPVAWMMGARSLLMTPQVLDNVRHYMPAGSPLLEIPEAGHHVMLDQPLAFVAALRGLLAGWP